MRGQLHLIHIVIEFHHYLARSNLSVLKLGIGPTRLSFLWQIDLYQITFFKEKLSPLLVNPHLILGICFLDHLLNRLMYLLDMLYHVQCL